MDLRSEKIKFKVVKFIKEDLIEVVPSSWIYKFGKKDFCYWPAIDNVRKLVRDEEEPSTDWSSHAVEILKSKGRYY